MTVKKKINLSKFQEMDIRAGIVRSVKKVEGSEKLLILGVDMGKEEISVVSGIGKEYKENDLAGSVVVVVVNLEPRDVMGIRSEGMILAVDDKSGPVILTVDKEISPGSRVR